jgi:5'-nucleotidase
MSSSPATCRRHPLLTALIAKYKALGGPLANRVIGTITADITRTNNAAGESALGDVIADAQLAEHEAGQRGRRRRRLYEPGRHPR